MIEAPLISLFLPSLHGGGAERVMVTLANELRCRGYRVEFVVAEAAGQFMGHLRDDVRLVDLGVRRTVLALFPLAGYLRKRKPLVLVSAMTHANLVAVAAAFLSRSRTKVAISEHAIISLWARQAVSFSSRWVFKLVPLLYGHADFISGVSHEVADDLSRFASLPAGRVRAIYNPFDLVEIRRRASGELAHPWFSPGMPPVILGMGRLDEAKGFETLIKAFAVVRETADARLLILGEGSLRAPLETMIGELGIPSSEVQLPGYVADPYPFLARCAVFALSSRTEGLPSVLIEAMACGASIVSTDCKSGPREILEGGRWGTLVPVGDAVALAGAISAALDARGGSDPRSRQRAEDFDKGVVVDAHLRFWGLPERAQLAHGG
jgi:glycosyltransferase involved in cell wall biosynthesis